MSADAKPCRAKASPRQVLMSSASGRGYRRAGLFTARRSVRSNAMSVAGEARRRKKAAALDNEPAFRGVADAEKESSGYQVACNALPPPDPTALLAWYDRHRRVLPWRARPGAVADPYRVWLSEIML